MSVPLIGETSYGKGSGTSSWTLGDDSAINVTIFEYYLPKGEAIEGKGLTPTHEVELDREALLNEMNGGAKTSESTQDSEAIQESNSVQDSETSESSESTETLDSTVSSKTNEASETNGSEEVKEIEESSKKNESSKLAESRTEASSENESENSENSEHKGASQNETVKKSSIKLVREADNQMQEAIKVLKSIDKQEDDPSEADITDENEEDLTGVIFNNAQNLKEIMIESKAKQQYYI